MTEAYDQRFSKSKQAQLLLVVHLKELFPLVKVEIEYQVVQDRKWRFDVAVPSLLLAVEIEGGIYVQGAHSRGAHYESDMEKYNRAALAGWLVLRFTPKQVLNGGAKAFIEKYGDEQWPLLHSPKTVQPAS